MRGGYGCIRNSAVVAGYVAGTRWSAMCSHLRTEQQRSVVPKWGELDRSTCKMRGAVCKTSEGRSHMNVCTAERTRSTRDLPHLTVDFQPCKRRICRGQRGTSDAGHTHTHKSQDATAETPRTTLPAPIERTKPHGVAVPCIHEGKRRAHKAFVARRAVRTRSTRENITCNLHLGPRKYLLNNLPLCSPTTS